MAERGPTGTRARRERVPPAAGATPPVPVRQPTPVPRWVAPLFAVLALGLLPWTLWVGVHLPERTVSENWNLAWAGFDLALVLALAATAWFAYRGASWTAPAATAAATLLVCDAWFDITTARSRPEVTVAVVQAVLVEIPLALTCAWVAHRSTRAQHRPEREPDEVSLP